MQLLSGFKKKMKISKDQVNYASILFLILISDHQMAAQKAIQQVLVEVEKWFMIKKSYHSICLLLLHNKFAEKSAFLFASSAKIDIYILVEVNSR